MIKVMIVEDEPPILRDVKNLIESIHPEFTVIACAYNGYEAINILEESTIPDIIFTDIQMPVVDGLDLLKYIHEKNLDIIPIVLSGYSEFSYAKKAMAYGVTSYLLKPLSTEELDKLLIEISGKVNQKKSMLEKEYISNLMENGSCLSDSNKVEFDYPFYSIMLMCVGSFPTYSIDYYSPRRSFWKSNNIENIVSEFMSKDERVWVFDGKTGAEQIAIFTLSESTYEKADFLSSVIAQRLNSSHYPITIVISSFTSKVEQIGNLMQSMRFILSKRAVIGLSQVIKMYQLPEKESAEANNIPFIDPCLENRLTLYIQHGNFTSFKQDMQKIFKQWEQYKYPQIWVEKLLRDIIFLCQRSIPGSLTFNPAELELEINEAISLSNNYTELFNNLWYIFEDLFDLRSRVKTHSDSIAVLMRKIDNYIRQNIAEPLNNQVLSDIFGLVPSYLSKLFREYKGMSPVDYLLHLRIERAKELITSQPNFFLKDIASAIGYSDPLYFSKIFKKETGMSPSEYRHLQKGTSG